MQIKGQAKTCIGEYGGIPIDDTEKISIMNRIGSFCPKPKKSYGIAIAAVFVCAIGIGIFLHTKNKILGWSCFGLAILAILVLIFTWALGGIMKYNEWKEDCKVLRSHNVYKIAVTPVKTEIANGYYRHKYVWFAIEEETFSDGHIISDEVYDAIDKMKLWAYYCEYTKKDHRSNQYLPKYAIYIIGEPTE